jgi:hypothetical protein
MANFFDEYRDWMNRNSGNLGDLLSASVELAGKLKPAARKANRTIAQLVNSDAVTVRALADGVGLAEIAGAKGLSPESVLEALGMTVKFATVIGAFV